MYIYLPHLSLHEVGSRTSHIIQIRVVYYAEDMYVVQSHQSSAGQQTVRYVFDTGISLTTYLLSHVHFMYTSYFCCQGNVHRLQLITDSGITLLTYHYCALLKMKQLLP